MKLYFKLFLFMILVVGITYSNPIILKGDNEKKATSTWQEAKTGDTLIPIPVQTSGASPFIDANDTVEIESRDKSIIFYSKNGERVYTPATNTWAVTISPDKYRDKAEKAESSRNGELKLNLNQRAILEWYDNPKINHGPPYIVIKFINMNYFLSSVVCEDWFYDEVVDAVGKKVWQIPFYANNLHINSPFAWMGISREMLGTNRGIVRMDFKTNRLTRFLLLPFFDDDTQWCHFQGKLYFTSHEKFIQVLDLQSGNISILNLPVDIKTILNKGVVDPNDVDYEFHFSNPVVRNGSLYTAIGHNGFLKYHFASGKWSFNILSAHSIVTHLAEIKDMLWLITAWSNNDSESDYKTYYGKIAFMDKNETIHYFPQFDVVTETKDPDDEGGPPITTYGVAPIRAYFSDADNIYFLSMVSDSFTINDDVTYSPEGTIIKLSGPNWQTVTMEPLCNSNRNPEVKGEYQIRESNLKLYKQFIPISDTWSGDYIDEETQSRRESCKVRYAMVEIPCGKAKPVDYTKKN